MIDILYMRTSFRFLELEYNYALSEMQKGDSFDNVWIKYSKENCNGIQIIRERSYYGFEIQIDNEYLSLPLISRYLLPEKAIRLNYYRKKGFDDLVNDVRKHFEVYGENWVNISSEKINLFYKQNPTYKIEWLP